MNRFEKRFNEINQIKKAENELETEFIEIDLFKCKKEEEKEKTKEKLNFGDQFKVNYVIAPLYIHEAHKHLIETKEKNKEIKRKNSEEGSVFLNEKREKQIQEIALFKKQQRIMKKKMIKEGHTVSKNTKHDQKFDDVK